MGKAPTGTRKIKNRVYGKNIKNPKKTRSNNPSPVYLPRLPSLPRRSRSRSLSPSNSNSNNKMITNNNNNKPSDNVNNLANLMSGIKMPKTRKPKIVRSPKQPTRRSTRGRIPRGMKEETLRKYVKEARELNRKTTKQRKEKKDFKQTVNNNLSSLLSKAMGSKKRRKSTRR